MSEVLTLQSLLNSLPATASPNAGNILAFDDNGNPTKTPVLQLKYEDISDKEAAGTVLTLEEFVKKYLVKINPGTFLAVNDPATVKDWSIQMTSSLSLKPRLYMMLLTKRTGANMDAPYRYLSFVMIPSFINTGEYPMFIVSCQTNGQGVFSAAIYKIPLTQIT